MRERIEVVCEERRREGKGREGKEVFASLLFMHLLVSSTYHNRVIACIAPIVNKRPPGVNAVSEEAAAAAAHALMVYNFIFDSASLILI